MHSTQLAIRPQFAGQAAPVAFSSQRTRLLREPPRLNQPQRSELPNHTTATPNFTVPFHHTRLSNSAVVNMPARLRPREIEPCEIPRSVRRWEVKFDTGCECGWYNFYFARCGHLSRTWTHFCGATIMDTRVGFCRTPAPSTNVRAVKITGSCRDCSP